MDVLSVSDVVAMPVVRAPARAPVAGLSGMHHPVRWVHSSELADIGPLLREGDLLLSTGVAMADGDQDLVEMVDSLADSGAAGLVIELGRRWTQLPQALVAACDARSLPLITLAREVRFAAVAQAVGERIVDQQLERAARGPARPRDVHRAEHRRGRAGRHPRGRPAARRRGRGARERAAPRPGLPAGAGDGRRLSSPTGRGARQASSCTGEPRWDEQHGWLVTRVGRKERGWGRLVVHVAGKPDRTTDRDGRACRGRARPAPPARPSARQRGSAYPSRAHRRLSSPTPRPRACSSGARSPGCPARGVNWSGSRCGRSSTARCRPGGTGRLEEVTAAVVHAAHELRVPALVCHLDGDVRALLSFAPSAAPQRIVDELADRVSRRHPVVVGASRPVSRQGEIDRGLREARQVVDSVRSGELRSRPRAPARRRRPARTPRDAGRRRAGPALRRAAAQHVT